MTESFLDEEDDNAGNRVSGALSRSVLEYVAQQIVDDPEAVVIEVDEGPRNRVELRLHVAPDAVDGPVQSTRWRGESLPPPPFLTHGSQRIRPRS